MSSHHAAREQMKADREARVEKEYRQDVDRYKELDKLKRKDRFRREKLRQDESAVKWLLVFGVFNIFMMIVPLVGGHWIGTSFSGFGVGYTTMRIGIFEMEIQMKCDGKNILEDKICRIIEGGMDGGKGIGGVKQINEVRQLTCSALTPRACSIMDRLWWISWIIIFFFGSAITFQFFATMLLYYYWNVSPHPTIRRTAMMFVVMTPFALCLGLGFYAMMKPDLIEFPRTWSSIVTSLTAGIPIFEVRAIYDWEIAWCFVWAGFATLSTVISAATFGCCLNKQQGEEELEDLEEWERDKALEESLMLVDTTYTSGAYGAAAPSTSTSQVAYGGAPMPPAFANPPPGGSYSGGAGWSTDTYDGGVHGGGDGTYGGGGGAYGGGGGGGVYAAGGGSYTHTVVYDSRTGPPVPPQMLAGPNAY